ncbi:MAG: sigma-70 family RNA polymerase sigma factor [Clostridia bacterium]|nr:sigma-70 family RNA polymerase sigma factor [Clostridia bacterium]
MQKAEEIYKDNFDTVFKYLYCLTHDENTSEELAQETFYRALKNINKFKGESKLSTWLCQIAKNLWYDELKKKKYQNVSFEENVNLVEVVSNENPEEETISKDRKIKLYEKLQKLDSTTREVIYLRITGDLSFKEIGTILNKTENWARVTYYRGKQKLKEVDSDEKE